MRRDSGARRSEAPRSLRCSTPETGVNVGRRTVVHSGRVRTERPMPSGNRRKRPGARRDLPDAASALSSRESSPARSFLDRSSCGASSRSSSNRRLAGQGHSLKESVLAHELYGKGTDFDGGTDPVVRVDARRLRDKLREYLRGPLRSRRHLAAEGQLRSGLRSEFRLSRTRLLRLVLHGDRQRAAALRTSGARESPSALWRSSQW